MKIANRIVENDSLMVRFFGIFTDLKKSSSIFVLFVSFLFLFNIFVQAGIPFVSGSHTHVQEANGAERWDCDRGVLQKRNESEAKGLLRARYRESSSDSIAPTCLMEQGERGDERTIVVLESKGQELTFFYSPLLSIRSVVRQDTTLRVSS